MKMNKFRFQVGLGVAIVSGVLLLLNACGGAGAPASPPQDKPSTPQTQPAATPSQPSAPPAQAPAQPAAPPAAQPPSGGSTTGTEIPVSIRDNTYDTVRVKAGTKVVFVITNTTDDMHTFEAPDFAIYKEVQPGETIRFPWTVSDRKGTWDLGCYLTSPGGVHDGMDVGHLIIE